eukprot:sb/3479100/
MLMPADSIKQPIRTRYLGHVTVYQPIRDQYFLIRSVPSNYFSSTCVMPADSISTSDSTTSTGIITSPTILLTVIPDKPILRTVPISSFIVRAIGLT